jgi:hypothetical protein
MIGEVAALKALAGYRGKPSGDLDALAKALWRCRSSRSCRCLSSWKRRDQWGDRPAERRSRRRHALVRLA